MRYWIAQGQELRGPFEFEELKNLEDFSKMSLVCPEQEAPGEDRRWLDAGSVPALTPLFAPKPSEREFPEPIAQDLPLSQMLYQKVERFEERLKEVISELKTRDEAIGGLKREIGERDRKIAALRKDFIAAAGRIDNMDDQLEALRDAGITPPAVEPEPAPPEPEPPPLFELEPEQAPEAAVPASLPEAGTEEPPSLSDPLPEPEPEPETVAEPTPRAQPPAEPAAEPAPVMEEPPVEPAPAKPSRKAGGALGRMSMGEKVFLAVPIFLFLGYLMRQGLREKEPPKPESTLASPPQAPAVKPRPAKLPARKTPRRRPARKSRKAPAKKKALPPKPDKGGKKAIAFLKGMPVIEPSIGSCPRSLKTVESPRERWREVKSLGGYFACAPLSEARGWLGRIEKTFSADTKAAAGRLRKDIRGWGGLGAVYPLRWKADHLYTSRYNITVRVRPALRYRLRDRYSPGQARRFSGGVPKGQDGPWEDYKYQVDLKRKTVKPLNFRAWKQLDQPAYYTWRMRQPRRPDGRLAPVNPDAEIREPRIYRAPGAKKRARPRKPAAKKKQPAAGSKPDKKSPVKTKDLGGLPGMSPR